MARVEIPTGKLTETIVGVQFVEGVAADVPEGTALAYFRRHGYIVEEADDTAKVPDGDPAKSWSNGQITAWAEANAVDLSGATTKAEMLAKIAAIAEAAKADAEATAKAEADAKTAENTPPVE